MYKSIVFIFLNNEILLSLQFKLVLLRHLGGGGAVQSRQLLLVAHGVSLLTEIALGDNLLINILRKRITNTDK